MGSEVSFDKHPALRNFNRTLFMAKHVFKGVLKWGAIGAVAGAVATGVGSLYMAMAVGGKGIGLGVLARYLPYGLGNFAKDLEGDALAGALQLGAGVAGVAGAGGALIGGALSFSGASAAADDEEDRLVAKYEQAQERKQRMAALERRRDEQRYAMEKQGMAMRNPNQQLPMGKPVPQGAGYAHS